MSTLTQIKMRIKQLGAAEFQEFCDALIYKERNGLINGYGMQPGTGKTTIGNPDTYIKTENGKYIFVCYTTQQSSIYKKILEDIIKCLNSEKSGLEQSKIEEIICCHTSSRLSAGEDEKLHEYCQKFGIHLTIWGIDNIANMIYDKYKPMAKQFLGLNIDTGQILSYEDFIEKNDKNLMLAPLNTIFQYREKEKKDIIDAMKTKPVVILRGNAGVGKTRLALEVIKELNNLENYRLLCVKNNDLNIYEDLVSYTEKSGKYLLFVDDANEFEQLNTILAYLSDKEDKDYQFKFILTVRDYVESEVTKIIEKYFEYIKIVVPVFSPEEIKGFLNKNLKIINEIYISQIIRICEGNPRIAYMAGKLALKSKKISSITNITTLYNKYYNNYINEYLENNRDLCFTAGILSAVKAVKLDNISSLKEILYFYGVDDKKIIDNIYALSKLEVVEIYDGKIASFSDKCLSNYMIYYVFIHKKIIPFSKLLELGYKYYSYNFKEMIKMLFNSFNSDEINGHISSEILDACNNIEEKNSEYYENFVRDFHIFMPEKGFLIFKNKVKSINNEEFKVVDVDFSKNAFTKDESVLEFLIGYNNSSQIKDVLILLLEYASKTSENMVLCYNWLEKYYGIRINDLNYKYESQIKISEYLFEQISKNSFVAAIGFQWAKYSLSFSFNISEYIIRNTFVFSKIYIRYSEQLKKYRNLCWNILLLLADKDEWKDKIISFLDLYSKNLKTKPDVDIASAESTYIEKLLIKIEYDQISYFIILKEIIDSFEKLGIKYDKKLKKHFSKKIWKLYDSFLYNPFYIDLENKNLQNNKDNITFEYTNDITSSKIKRLVKNVNKILSDKSEKVNAYLVNEGLLSIIEKFDYTSLQEFLKEFIKYGNNISIKPQKVLKLLNDKNKSLELLELIKKSNFPQKNEWMFYFFETLPISEINSSMLTEFLDFLRSETDKDIKCSSYRNMRVLDKFLNLDPNIYITVSDIIYGKRHYNEYIVKVYFYTLFYKEIYSSSEILKIYKNNTKILKDIYFFIIKRANSNDFLDEKFSIEFILEYEEWFFEYADVFCKNANEYIYSDDYIIKYLWKSDNYMRYFDYIFNKFYEFKLDDNIIIKSFKRIFENFEEDHIKQKTWINHIIYENSKKECINVIFDFICELSYDIRKSAIETLINNNKSYETFNKLCILPDYCFGIGSLVLAYQKQIDFIKSLYPIFEKENLYEHKNKLVRQISDLEKKIKKEELETRFFNLKM